VDLLDTGEDLGALRVRDDAVAAVAAFSEDVGDQSVAR
jgi:hypothetical protein